jgi:small-conductance mechanosensitive channel/CRP-like cAMP-binding protein
LHQTAHLFWAVGILIALIGTMVIVRNRIIRRRLLWSALFLLVATVLHFVIADRWNLATDPAARSIPQAFFTEEAWKIEGLLIAFALLNAIVPLLFNPWFRDQPSDHAPAIVQDTLVAAFGVVAAMAIFQNSTLFTSSAIAAAILGFALQDTLGNAISGIAIQIEKPFRVGHWISVGGFEGLVTEVTWRATKIRTKAGNQVIVPNSTIAKDAINNYSEPTAPTRLEIEVGAAYQATPGEVKAAILRAIDQAPGVLKTPLPDALLVDFANSAIVYRARFWIDDFSRDNHAKDAVRTAIYYEFKRRGIEIPYPIQVEYSKEEAPVDTPERRDRFRQALAAVHVLAPLPPDAHRALAETVRESLFANGELVVREGEAGDSMFIVLTGEVAIVVGPERREVAVTKAGGYFGEMSLLTGDPRTATVLARGETTVLEISAAAFRAYVKSNPGVIDELAAAAVARRRELEESRGKTPAPAAAATVSLAQRMRHFFGIGERAGQVIK